MLVQPPRFIANTLAAKINEAELKGKDSCLDDPKIAAVHLKTKDDLALFYGKSSESAITGVVAITFQVAVAVIATVAALAFNGNSSSSSHELNETSSEDVFSMDVDDLLNARCKALKAS